MVVQTAFLLVFRFQQLTVDVIAADAWIGITGWSWRTGNPSINILTDGMSTQIS